MRLNIVWALVALNVVLLVCLVTQWLKPNTAMAQAAPRPSDYILIPGTIQGNPVQIIYMIDTQSGLLSARSFDGRQMVDMPPIDLNRFFNPQQLEKPKRLGHGL